MDNINEWQHSAMYLAFLISGVVDLVGFYAPKGTLPPGTEQVNALSFSRRARSACSSWSQQVGWGGLHLRCLQQ